MKFLNDKDIRGEAPAKTICDNKIRKQMQFRFNAELGRDELVEIGEKNVYLEKQEAVDDCLIYSLIDRYNAGDYTAIRQRQATFIDVVGMPKTLMEAHALMRQGSDYWNTLPVEIKQKFNNDVGQYLKAFNEHVNSKPVEPTEPKKSEVIETNE